MAMFNSYVTNYQRVNAGETISHCCLLKSFRFSSKNVSFPLFVGLIIPIIPLLSRDSHY